MPQKCHPVYLTHVFIGVILHIYSCIIAFHTHNVVPVNTRSTIVTVISYCVVTLETVKKMLSLSYSLQVCHNLWHCYLFYGVFVLFYYFLSQSMALFSVLWCVCPVLLFSVAVHGIVFCPLVCLSCSIISVAVHGIVFCPMVCLSCSIIFCRSPWHCFLSYGVFVLFYYYLSQSMALFSVLWCVCPVLLFSVAVRGIVFCPMVCLSCSIIFCRCPWHCFLSYGVFVLFYYFLSQSMALFSVLWCVCPVLLFSVAVHGIVFCPMVCLSYSIGFCRGLWYCSLFYCVSVLFCYFTSHPIVLFSVLW